MDSIELPVEVHGYVTDLNALARTIKDTEGRTSPEVQELLVTAMDNVSTLLHVKVAEYIEPFCLQHKLGGTH